MFCRLLFLLSIISPFILSAQIATEIKLEPALISVIYERRMEYDTLNRNNKVRINTLTLKAGKNHSAFYDARLKWIDSMEYINDDYIHSLYEGVKYYSTKGALHQIKLFKNYPEGKIRIHDAFDLCRWHIDEDIENLNGTSLPTPPQIYWVMNACWLWRDSEAGSGTLGSLPKYRFLTVRGNYGGFRVLS